MADFASLYKHVLFGVLSYNRNLYLIYKYNLIIMLAKFHNFSKKTLVFHKECEQYLQNIK